MLNNIQYREYNRAQALTHFLGETGRPVAGVSIAGEGKNKTTVTNISGFYRLAGIKTGTHTLTIKAEGYRTEVVKVIRGKTVALNINLASTLVKLSAEEAA